MDSQRVLDTINYIKKNLHYYSPASCTFHRHQYCFVVHSNVNNTTYHALLDHNSKIYIPFYEKGSICNVPLFHKYMRELNALMSDDLTLPTVTFIRDSHGVTSLFYQLRKNLFPPSLDLKPENLLNVFVGYALSVCASSLVMHGVQPNIQKMLFVYTHEYPVLVDLDRYKCAEFKEVASKKDKKTTVVLKINDDYRKWRKFMQRSKTLIPILRYTTVVFPQFFTKQRKKACVLRSYSFSDLTHTVLCEKCKTLSLSDFLKLIHAETEIHGVYKTLVADLLNKL